MADFSTVAALDSCASVVLSALSSLSTHNSICVTRLRGLENQLGKSAMAPGCLSSVCASDSRSGCASTEATANVLYWRLRG